MQKPNKATEIDVRAEQIRTLFRQSTWILIINPVNAAIVAAVLWATANRIALVGWVAAMAAVAAYRSRLVRVYERAAPPAAETMAWARRFVIGASLAGLLWGLGAALFYDPKAVTGQLLITFVVGGMVAGASGTLASHMPAYAGFAAGAIVPFAARYLGAGDGLHATMGALAIVYGIAMTGIALSNHRVATLSFQLRFENRDLLERLTRAQVSLEEINRTLEQRVAERGAALERQTEALRDAQRMESVGLLAGGVAHDFNNLLTIVLGNVELLLERPQGRVEERQGLEEIRRAANRGAILVSQLLTFGRRQVTVRRVLDLNAVVAEVQPLLGRLIGEHIELVVAMEPRPLAVKADATQLHQVIINLATNARDAMPAGGKLTIETELADEIGGEVAGDPGPFVVLSVRDTGVGMDPETRRMAFHPFFTTKEVGRGTGLGLATVYGIVEQNGGRILIESEPGQGSCFRVYLPRAAVEELGPPLTPATSRATHARRAATVLLAEDDPAVRSVTARILRSAGLEVLEAGEGEEALAVAGRYEGTIDLLVSDVVMAKCGGVELAQRLTAERPDLHVLLVSGYSREAMPVEDPTGNVVLLQKPYTPAALLERVSQLLDGTTAPLDANGKVSPHGRPGRARD